MLSSLQRTCDTMQMGVLNISHLRVVGIQHPGTMVTLPIMISPSGRATKVPGILTLMPVNILMTMMVNGSRGVTMEHHIKITIPHIMPHTNLISSSPMTLSSPNILEKSLGKHMRSSLTSWPTSFIGMRPPSLRSWWRPRRMLLSHSSVAEM